MVVWLLDTFEITDETEVHETSDTVDDERFKVNIDDVWNGDVDRGEPGDGGDAVLFLRDIGGLDAQNLETFSLPQDGIFRMIFLQFIETEINPNSSSVFNFVYLSEILSSAEKLTELRYVAKFTLHTENDLIYSLNRVNSSFNPLFSDDSISPTLFEIIPLIRSIAFGLINYRLPFGSENIKYNKFERTVCSSINALGKSVSGSVRFTTLASRCK